MRHRTLPFMIASVVAACSMALFGVGTSQAATKANFSLSVSPATVSIPAGQQALMQVSIARSRTFRSRVTLTLVGLPAGVSVSTSNASSTRVTFLLKAPTNTAVSQTVVRLVGKGGGLTRETSFAMQVNCSCTSAPPVTAAPPPATVAPVTTAAPSVGDYALTIDPAQVTLNAGDATRHAIFVNGVGGFRSTVRFELKGLPAGARAAFLPEFAQGGTTLLITTSSTTPKGDYALTVNAVDGARVRSVPLTLSVRTGSDFSIVASASTVSLVAGGQTTFSVSASPLTSVSSDVDITLAGLPTGSLVSPATARIQGSGTANFVLTLPTNASAGIYRVTATGVSGSFVKSAFVDLTVQPVVSLLLSPSAASAPKGSISTFGVTLASTPGTNTPVLQITAVPPASSATLLINADGSRFVQITTSAATPAGTYPVSLTAYVGSVQVTSTAQLTVT